MQELTTSEVIHWADAEVRLERDGSLMRMVRGQHLVVELGWVNASTAEPSLVTDDEVEHCLATDAGRLLQRAAINDGWRNRWVLVRDHDGSVQVEERVRIRPGPEYTLWNWDSGVSTVIVIAPAHAAGPVLAFRLEQGFLELAEDPDASSAWVEYLVAPTGTVLETGDRLVTVLAGHWYPGLEDVEHRMPPWSLDTQLDEGVPWVADLADCGVQTAPDLTMTYIDGQVMVEGPPGLHRIAVTNARGMSMVDLEWVPQLEVALHKVVDRVLASGQQPTAAEAFCVQMAADRHAVWLSQAGHDLLDVVDWESSDSLFAAAFALIRGRALGEGALVSDALRWLARRPVGVGYGRVAMAGFLASVSVGLDAQSRCLDMLSRPAVGRTAALESSLLHYRSADFGAAELAGVANRLGGLLPGDSPLMSATESAELVGLLELCPPEWPHAAYYAQVAAKARGKLLCSYVSGHIGEAEPLAWLLLTPELSATA